MAPETGAAPEFTYDNLLKFRQAMDMCGDAIYLVDRNTMKFIDVNTTASERMGYSREELLRMGPADLLMIDRKELEKEYDQVIAAGANGLRSESRALTKDGRKSIAEMHRRPLQMGDRWIIVSIARDITQRKRAEQAAVRLGRMYAALSATEEAILHTTSPGELYQRVCDAAVDGGKFLTTAVLLKQPDDVRLHLAAASGQGLQALHDSDISIDENEPGGRGLVGTACRSGEPRVSNDYINDPNTTPWHDLANQVGIASGAAVPIRHGGEVTGVLLFYSNEKYGFDQEIISLLQRMIESMVYALDNFDREAERRRDQARIEYLATHDGLTGLPNRVMFKELLRLAVETGKRHRRQFALIFIDLDRFKLINDSLGHDAGDQLLTEMATRFKTSLRASDVIARLSGDEFVALVQDVRSREQITSVAHKLLSAAFKPVEVLGQECRVTGSIGIATYPTDGTDEQTLMKNADMAMYQAKEEGKNNFQFYSSDIKDRSLERSTIETQLRNALNNQELYLQYQAKMSSLSGRINGVEALLRWNNPVLGEVTPTQLIPVAEETGLIIAIGRWVLKTACAQNAAWQDQGLPPVCVSVNLSMSQFTDPNLLGDIATILKETGINPELLELELTESMILGNVDSAVKTLSEIKRMGVRLAIDDFGIGYSEISQIRRYPIDTLKVDRSFIRNISTDKGNRSITEAIIAMGKMLSMTVVAEGVETPEQERLLREIACDEMQGFRFSRPVGAEEFAALLSKQP